MDPLEDICGLISCAIDDDPPTLLKDGGVIRKGYSKELDSLQGDCTQYQGSSGIG